MKFRSGGALGAGPARVSSLVKPRRVKPTRNQTRAEILKFYTLILHAAPLNLGIKFNNFHSLISVKILSSGLVLRFGNFEVLIAFIREPRLEREPKIFAKFN